ncbi:MAG TPA: efflux RND transporter periplasmic adaptor subunit [Candidatus Magasanikbacteria bacterium]|nr:efflux RND transporter periplasmic adaptor subunit [Candidatus Magasanikbacteria bacterium]
MKKILIYLKGHKIATLFILAFFIGGGYWSYQKWFVSEQTVRYINVKAEKGTLISSLSGTGQVSSETQVDLKTKAGGEVTYVGFKVGQEVKSGQLLLSLDARDALKSVRDAETSLRSAQISYEKFMAPTEELTILQAENSLLQTKENLRQTEDNLKKYYEDGFNTVSNAFLELPGLISGMKSMIFDNDFEKYQPNIDWYLNQGLSYDYDNQQRIRNYRQDTLDAYEKARINYDKNFEDFKNASRDSSASAISDLIWQTYETVKALADTVKNMNNYVDFIQDAMGKVDYKVSIPSLMTTHQSSLDNYTAKTNSHLSSLLQIKNSIESAKISIESSKRSVAEKEISLTKLKSGNDILDIESQKISLKQKENSLLDAKEKLANYYVYAPFEGILASFNIKKGDTLSSGAIAGTLMTKQKVATIALNEVDAAKVKVGQKVILSFDAIEDLTITGEIAEVDALGTVSQGVVSYNIKIVFDTQDERVKPGMTVTANITISVKQDVLMVRSSAVKTQNGQSYVEVLQNEILTRKNVVIGDSNDTMTEIISGLEEGEEVVSQTISTSQSATTNNTTNRTNNFGSGQMRMMMP